MDKVRLIEGSDRHVDALAQVCMNVKKLDEVVQWINGVDKQLTELYQQQEQLLKKNKMRYWKDELGQTRPQSES